MTWSGSGESVLAGWLPSLHKDASPILGVVDNASRLSPNRIPLLPSMAPIAQPPGRHFASKIRAGNKILNRISN